jgi:uncharacterized lipoprotein YehR (DUF1307 family)
MGRKYLAEKAVFIQVVFIAVLALNGCGDECKEYSNYSCKQLDTATYNTYFYFPDGNKQYSLGVAEGLANAVLWPMTTQPVNN